MSRGEMAIRAINKAARAAAKRPESLNEAVSNKMDERLARLEADGLMKPPENLVKAAGEVVDLANLGFISSYLVDTLEQPNMLSVDASEQRMNLATSGAGLQLAVDAAESAQAGNSLEKMLCHQMAAAHRAAMKLSSYAFGLNIPHVEIARLTNAAARMMQVYQEAFLTLQRIRTGGKQTVVVQHVQVSESGKAVVGVNLGARGRPKNSSSTGG